MDRKLFYNKKIFSIIILSFILLSLFATKTDFSQIGGADTPINQSCLDAQELSVNKIVCAQSFLRSAAQSVLQRQAKLQKKTVGCNVEFLFVTIDLPAFFVISISILSLYYFVSNCSHRFVIRFIHKQDGQKA